MTDALQKICADKRQHIARQKAVMPVRDVEAAARQASSPRGFHAALEKQFLTDRYGLIAEVKKASPSKGVIRHDFDPAALATAYERGGATCLSVLTDIPYFMGHDQHLINARTSVSLPVLRKDFMIDPYQVAEARMLGADCILLIMAALEDSQAAELEDAATEWEMDVLIEVHDAPELDRAMNLRSPLLGINNRNLKTLGTSLDTTRELAPRAAGTGRLVVSESGLYTAEDLAEMYACGARSFLIGESLMRQDNVELATQQLLGKATGAAAA